MAGKHTYCCEICGIDKREVNRWLLVRLAAGAREFTVREWDEETARKDPEVLTVCGQAHVHRMLDAFFSAAAASETNPAEQCSPAAAAHRVHEPAPGAPPKSEGSEDLSGTSDPPLSSRVPDPPAPTPSFPDLSPKDELLLDQQLAALPLHHPIRIAELRAIAATCKTGSDRSGASAG